MVRVKLGWKLFFSFFFEIPGDQLQDHKLFGTNQGVINGKKLKKGGHCSNFTDYSTKIANNSRLKNHTDNSRNYAGTFRGGLIINTIYTL